ncbi:hypothetical protein FGO68_gene12057 [Halteria grandinella]|uniref:Uncharacterized protein n=1 Tax=Halteria grandinella TaxID=5974 RepID=A0A8J8NHH4_HALGN|nr:hypothetical protein FGO68_gene12057 [Halteria grandinella]
MMQKRIVIKDVDQKQQHLQLDFNYPFQPRNNEIASRANHSKQTKSYDFQIRSQDINCIEQKTNASNDLTVTPGTTTIKRRILPKPLPQGAATKPNDFKSIENIISHNRQETLLQISHKDFSLLKTFSAQPIEVTHSRQESHNLAHIGQIKLKAMRSADSDVFTPKMANNMRQVTTDGGDADLAKLKSFLKGDFQANVSFQKQNERRKKQIAELKHQFGQSPPLPATIDNPSRISLVQENQFPPGIKIKVSLDTSPINAGAFRYDRATMSKSLVDQSNPQSSNASPMAAPSLLQMNSGYQSFTFQQYIPQNYKSDQNLIQQPSGNIPNNQVLFNNGKDFFVKPKLLLKSFNEKKISLLALAAKQAAEAVPLHLSEKQASQQTLSSPTNLPIKHPLEMARSVSQMASSGFGNGSDHNTPAFTHPSSLHDAVVAKRQAESTFKKAADHNRASMISGGDERFEEIEIEEHDDSSLLIGQQSRPQTNNPSKFNKRNNDQQQEDVKKIIINSKVFNFDEASINAVQVIETTPIESVVSSSVLDGQHESLNTNSFLNSTTSHYVSRTPYIDSMTPSPQKQAPLVPMHKPQQIPPVRKSLQIQIPQTPPPHVDQNGSPFMFEGSAKSKIEERERIVSEEVIEIRPGAKNSRSTTKRMRQQRQSITIKITDEEQERDQHTPQKPSARQGGRKTLSKTEQKRSSQSQNEVPTQKKESGKSVAADSTNGVQRVLQGHRDTMALVNGRKLSVDHLAVNPQVNNSHHHHSVPRRSVIVKSDSLEKGGFISKEMIQQHEQVRRQLRKSASPSQFTDGSSTNGHTELVSNNSKSRRDKSLSGQQKTNGEAKLSLKYGEFKATRNGTESGFLTNTLSQQSTIKTISAKPIQPPKMPNANQPRKSQTGIVLDPEKIRFSLQQKVDAEKIKAQASTAFNTNKETQRGGHQHKQPRNTYARSEI